MDDTALDLLNRAKPFLEAHRDGLAAKQLKAVEAGDTNTEPGNVDLDLLLDLLNDIEGELPAEEIDDAEFESED